MEDFNISYGKPNKDKEIEKFRNKGKEGSLMDDARNLAKGLGKSAVSGLGKATANLSQTVADNTYEERTYVNGNLTRKEKKTDVAGVLSAFVLPAIIVAVALAVGWFVLQFVVGLTSFLPLVMLIIMLISVNKK